MTTDSGTEVERRQEPPYPMTPAAPGPEIVGQATAIEMSRAVAEVQAAIIVAQRVPRNVATAMGLMRESCTQPALADRAFFRYPRGRDANGQPVIVTGPSVHLARELARCWGNIQYNVIELRRDVGKGESEMQAFAWDVQVNVRSALTFVVPHKRDTKRGAQDLVDMRDIYENNANMGARRLRETIFSVMPTWFVQQAQDLCSHTIAHPAGDKPLGEQIADAIQRFADMQVTRDQLEQKVGRVSGEWQPFDLAMLRVIFTSLRRGEISKDDEFPPPSVTAEEIAEQARRRSPRGRATPRARASAPADATSDAPADVQPSVQAPAQEAVQQPLGGDPAARTFDPGYER
jgi:hypothetical protein